jgi:hypothetical protein
MVEHRTFLRRLSPQLVTQVSGPAGFLCLMVVNAEWNYIGATGSSPAARLKKSSASFFNLVAARFQDALR